MCKTQRESGQLRQVRTRSMYKEHSENIHELRLNSVMNIKGKYEK